MHDRYVYALAQCDVPPERHAALQSFRDKRRLWLSWLDTDEHPAIWTTLHSMVWTDVAFKTLTDFAVGDDKDALNNPLILDAALNGHVATQVLAIRRLMDKGSSDVISLRRLVKDLRRNCHLFGWPDQCQPACRIVHAPTQTFRRLRGLLLASGRAPRSPVPGPTSLIPASLTSA